MHALTALAMAAVTAPHPAPAHWTGPASGPLEEARKASAANRFPHHNELTGLNQRAPRVRHGQVHVYNNAYVVPAGTAYTYSWGVGVNSAIYAQNNSFSLPRGTTADKIIYGWGGTAIHEEGTLVNGRPVSALAAYNAVKDPDLGGDVGRGPGPHRRVDPARAVPALVKAGAGAGRIS